MISSIFADLVEINRTEALEELTKEQNSSGPNIILYILIAALIILILAGLIFIFIKRPKHKK